MTVSSSSAPKPEKKKKPARRRASRGFRIYSLLLSLLVIGAVGAIAWAFLPVGNSNQPILVEIPNSASARSIGELLRDKGVIRSEIAFLLMAKMLGETSHMQAGDYELSQHMTLAQIITILARGEGVAKWVTIPEGYTLRQVAEEIGDAGLGDPRRIERIARAGGESFRKVSFSPPRNLEGYLFPDTYKIRRKATEREIIAMMLKTFDEKAYKPLRREFRQAEARGFPLSKTLILASLIEREARKKEEQPIIAGVIMNRLHEGMKLQVDATVQYALVAPKRRLTYKDLEVASPYNTYRISGLPPGAICNPGLNAIKAALHPASVHALYYVAKPDGSHIFTRTLEEHNAAKARVRRLAKKTL
jgi:UPF0755 protein